MEMSTKKTLAKEEGPFMEFRWFLIELDCRLKKEEEEAASREDSGESLSFCLSFFPSFSLSLWERENREKERF